eukprot:gnl/Hemi2/10017_TR3466_c0_g2_i1.p1 gnl/Hemi2/10017_TR3466_c0_g2~~gnl/Hemi2/10017_TR3466_c0_g2_i1.p1  ORF type:complete len:353 (+),score=99.88 gnl/Hemi2/10017_TR3466_c0_g2_i1:88-1146(+)
MAAGGGFEAAMDSKPREPTSWGAAIKQYEMQKRSRTPLVQQQLHIFANTSRKMKEDPFNPVAGVYKLPEVEARIAGEEHAERMRSLNKAEKAHMRQTYSINPGEIAKVDKRGIGIRKITTPGGAVQRGHNRSILAHEDPVAPKTVITRPTRVTAVNKPRDFSILSNDYHQDHAEKFQGERMRAREAAETSLAKRGDFNAVSGRFYDAVQDHDKYVEYFLKHSTKHQNKFAKMPASLTNSESVAYNTLTNVPVDTNKLAAIETKERALYELNVKRRRFGRELELQKQRDGHAEGSNSRSLATRVQRDAIQSNRGYNIINNDHAVSAPARPNLWQRCVALPNVEAAAYSPVVQS